MFKIIRPNGEELTEEKEILQEAKCFYGSLYTSKDEELLDVDIDAITDGGCPKLSYEESLSLEGEINVQEATNAIKNMCNNKSPG